MAFDWSFLEGSAVEEEEIEGGLKASALNTIGSTIGGVGRLASDYIPGVGDDNFISEYGRELQEDNPVATRSLSDITDRPLTAISEVAGQAGTSIGGMLATRAIGTGITALSPLAGPAAPVVAGIGQLVANLGPVAISALPSYSSIRDKQIFDDPQANESAKSKLVALVGAGTVGAIETKFGPQNWALGLVTKEGRDELAKKFTATTFGGRLLEAGAKGAAVESLEEILQSPIEQIASNEDPTTPASISDTAFGAAMGAIGGGLFGAGFGAVGSTKQQTEGTESTPQWQEALDKIREKEVITKEPEKVLSASGIDTTQDAKPVVPEMFQSLFETQAESAPYNPQREVPSTVNKGEAEWVRQQRLENLSEDIDNFRNPPPPVETRDIPEVPENTQPQYLSDKELVRVQNAQREIDKYFSDDTTSKFIFEDEVVDVSSMKVKDAIKASLLKKEDKVAELKQKAEATSNLKEKNKVNQEIKSTQREITSLKKETQTVAKKTEQKETIQTSALPEVQKALIETKQTKPGKKVPKGWTTEVSTVDGKDIKVYKKDNIVAIKKGDRSWIGATQEDGDRINQGTFKSMKDLDSAISQGKNADEFYQKTEENKLEVTKEQLKLVASVNPQSVLQKASSKAGVSLQDNNKDLEDIVNDSIVDSSAKYDPKSKASFETYATARAIGAIRDYKKTVGQTTSLDTMQESGQKIKKVSVPDRVSTPVVEQKETPPVKSVKISDSERKTLMDRIKEKQEKDKQKSDIKKLIGSRKNEKESTKERNDDGQKRDEGQEEREGQKERLLKEPTRLVERRVNTLRKAKESIEKLPDTATKEEIVAASKYPFVKNQAASKKSALSHLTSQLQDKNGKREEVLKGEDVTPASTESGDSKVERNYSVNSKKLLQSLQLNKTQKAILDIILSASGTKLDNVEVRDVTLYKNKKGETVPSLPNAFYADGHIYIDPRVKEYESVVLHEVIHALTRESMKSNKVIKEQVTQLLQKVRTEVLTLEEQELLEWEYEWNPRLVIQNKQAFRKQFNRLSDQVYYALLNEDEFLAQAFSSESFQTELKKIQLEKPTGTLRTIWDKFISIVREALGLTKDSYTALDETLTLATKLFKENIGDVGAYSISPSLVDNKKKSTKSWEDRVKSMRTNPSTKDSIGNQLRAFTRDILKASSEIYRQLDSKIGSNILRIMRKYEQSIAEANVKARDEIKSFMDGYTKMSSDDKNLLDLTLMNNKPDYVTKRSELLKKYNLTDSYGRVEALLKKIYNNREELGLNEYGSIPEYFPRRVKDMDGLIKAMAQDPNYSFIQQSIDQIKNKEEKEHAIRQMVNTGRIPAIALLKGTAGKKRTIETVSSEWKHFYETAPEALLNHIYESHEIIAAHRMFADSTARHKLVTRRNNLYNKIESEKLTEDEMKDTVATIEQIEAQLKDPNKRFDKIDSLLSEKASDLSPEDSRLVINTIRARLTQKGMHGIAATARNISLMAALGSPTSAITQIGDQAFNIYKFGPKNTIRAMFGPRIISAKDLDLEHSMKEFQTEGAAKWLDKVLTVVGLKYMDLFGKNTFMNAALISAKELNLSEFKEKYEYILGDDTEKTFNDIKGDKNTELTRFFVFNELSDWQPISLTEMPVRYQGAGNGRIFYALKSYNIKALNNIYRELVYNWRTAKDLKGKQSAAYNTGKLITLMVLAGATADELKEFLLGQSSDSFADNVHENLLKIGFMSRYTLDQGFSKGFFETMLKDILIPPTGIVDDPFRDIISTFEGDPDWRTVQNLPFGKLIYSWWSDRTDENEFKKIRKNIVDGVKEGDSVSKYRKEINKYNQWVREYNRNNREDKKDAITFSSLMVAKRKYQKEQKG